MQYRTEYQSPMGKITIYSDGVNITALDMEKHRYGFDTSKCQVTEKDDLEVLAQAKDWLDRYFRGEEPGADELPLAPAGSEFRQRVWKSLCAIPYGKVITYGDIAKEIAAEKGLTKMSAQAVGGAVGHNPISIIIPCHRVVGTNGSLTGYGGGIENKVKLLELEKVDMSGLYVPKKGTAL